LPGLKDQYDHLRYVNSPQILVQALKLYGTKEIGGHRNNPKILAWALEVGGWIGRWYDKDSIPWCGLFIAVCCSRAGLPYNQRALSALSWASWGVPVDKPSLGDVMTFTRSGGGHVGLYVGEDEKAYHILGGNQSDEVNVTRISKNRFYEARRTKWKYKQPKSVQVVKLAQAGTISINEA